MPRRMLPRQAYAGTLPGEPMIVPRNTVLLLYNPSGSVTATMYPRRGMAAWSINFTDYGSDTLVPVDGLLWGTAVSSGTGSIAYVYFPRDLVQSIRFDTVSPQLILGLIGSVVGHTYNGGALTEFYTVPAGYNAVVSGFYLSLQYTGSNGTGAVTAAEIQVKPQGTSPMDIAKDSTGGTIATNKFYELAAAPVTLVQPISGGATTFVPVETQGIMEFSSGTVLQYVIATSNVAGDKWVTNLLLDGHLQPL
jgi:hypothetical protein